MKVFTYIMMVGALCCLFCYSKEKEDAPTGATFNKTFVTGYLTPESIVISKMNSGIKITFKGDLITSGRSFDALSIYYNDLSYTLIPQHYYKYNFLSSWATFCCSGTYKLI